MREIVNRLHENRQIELAKAILEAKGYKVTKLNEYTTDEYDDEEITSSIQYMKNLMFSISELLDDYGGKDKFVKERESTAELDIPCELLGGDYSNVYTVSDEDEGGAEALELFFDLDRKDIKTVHLPNRQGYCILVDTILGEFVYQNQWGMNVLFKKF